ncbi:hypothetical protein RNT16_11885 [Staphylococcus pseudintermedius]|uniref:hypothetical protein n=1 Tax=Staphylococcus pseudintermedius TaxID=283734 RepID=UPI00288494CC|nr:hypothetical protein [Staphylococcus pseudintermedius]MDT1130386.1 hypothetical protein [Staphylococcus pseudintermedius]
MIDFIYIRVIEVGDKMNDRFYIYKCFFQEEPYFHLTMTQKFFLSLLYSLSDEEGYLPMQQKQLGEMIGLTKVGIGIRLSYLYKTNIVTIDNNKVVKVTRPHNREFIPLNEEFVYGKYRNLSEGAKMFYTYYRYIQLLEKADYLKIKGTEIGKPLNLNVRSIQKYYIELENVGLLIKSKDSGMNKLRFLEI